MGCIPIHPPGKILTNCLSDIDPDHLIKPLILFSLKILTTSNTLIFT